MVLQRTLILNGNILSKTLLLSCKTDYERSFDAMMLCEIKCITISISFAVLDLLHIVISIMIYLISYLRVF